MSTDAPLAAVHHYVDVFNSDDVEAMAAACTDSMQILDGLPPHVWQGPTAVADWHRDVYAESAHLGWSNFQIALGEPRHVDVKGDTAYVVVPATMTSVLRGEPLTQSGSLFTVALRKVGTEWRLTAWTWSKGT